MVRPVLAATAPAALLLAAVAGMYVSPAEPQNLVLDPSFEVTKPKDSAGRVFAKWEGWKFEGECEFEIGRVAHSGKTSAMLSCSAPGKIRINQAQELPAGRYRITAHLRGLDIGIGQWNQTTEFMFADKYFNLSKNGNFGWTPMTYVADLTAPGKAGPSFGLWAPGMFWVDDVVMERVGNDVKLTAAPVFGAEEAPIAPPGPLTGGAVRCPRCGYRNMPNWEKCYGCGTMLEERSRRSVSRPPLKSITSFENGNPFNNGAMVAEHATDGQKALRIDRGYAVMQQPQDWSGYDFLKVDTYTDAKQLVTFGIEIQDTGTHDYWTRVNYGTVIPPGPGTVILPLAQIFVGEKSRPGRKLILNGITRLVFILNDAPAGPVYLDNVRLERDLSAANVFFDGLYAFDFGTGTSPVMDGFTAITPATTYSAGRGFGLKNAKIWRAFDALQPDPLYQDFICIESGGLAVDVPDGKYRVFVNIDSPGGFWGESQRYRERTILAQGKKVVSETMNMKSFMKKYFQFWDQDDLPAENTFDKYDGAHFSPKMFDVDVRNGQLYLEFEGQNWANSVSAVIMFPLSKAAEGARFLDWLKEKRRFYFDNAFKRVMHRPTGDAPAPSTEDTRRGYLLFSRDPMEDLYYNDTPHRTELGQPAAAEAFAGQEEPVTVAVIPLQDLGRGALTVSALTGPKGTIPASAIEVGYVSYRITRETGDGAVYTISPRLVIPRNSVAMPKGVARQFWIDVHTPTTAAPGIYAGQLKFTPQLGEATSLPMRFTVLKGTLAATDIPVGPFGGQIGIPWISDDPETAIFTATMTEKSLHALRARGFTMFSGVPYVPLALPNGKIELNFDAADKQMRVVKELGFLAVSSYGAGVIGLNAYFEDTEKLKAAGMSDYSAFVKTIYAEVERHAREKGWPAVYWNLCDEPTGADLKRSVENARAYRAAFPSGPPFFTGATSLYVQDEGGLHLALAEALHVPALNNFDEAGVKRLREHGSDWAFYNLGSRWTFGEYLFKAAQQFGLKYRLAWHWNIVAGDPYYALDSREDDYAWANATPDMQLVPSLEFMRIAAGLNDYRYLLTLSRLAREKSGTPAGQAAAQLLAKRMGSFQLGDRTRNPGPDYWRALRQQVGSAIEAMQ